MNIYRNTGQFISELPLPANPTFNSITTSALKINGDGQGDILTTDASGNVSGLPIGAQNYILNSNSGVPAWTNNIIVNSTNTGSLTIPGTASGDLLYMNSAQTAVRLPLGFNGSKLVVVSNNPTWMQKEYAFVSIAGDTFTGFVSTTITNFSLYTSPYFYNFVINTQNIAYTGAGGNFKIIANLSLTADQDNSLWEFYIMKNNIAIPASGSYFQLKSNDYCNMTALSIVNLISGDVIKMALTRVDTGSGAAVTTQPFSVIIESVL